MNGRILLIEVFRRLRCAFLVSLTLWGDAASASGSGTACRHFEQCPKSYAVLISLLALYLLWLAWGMFSSHCKGQDRLRGQKEAKQREQKKQGKKQTLNQSQKQQPEPASEGPPVASDESQRLRRDSVAVASACEGSDEMVKGDVVGLRASSDHGGGDRTKLPTDAQRVRRIVQKGSSVPQPVGLNASHSVWLLFELLIVIIVLCH